jgi:F-type H+-transporting ATPase subunit b
VQLNWSTFVLEIINFLVLVWILKRFLYRPVLAAIAERKAAIDKTISEADARRHQAETLEQQYRSRLDDWDREKTRIQTALDEQMRGERTRATQELQKVLDQEREKERVLAQRRLAEVENRAAEQGMANGVKFTARLLERIASPELEARLVVLALEELPHLPPAQKQALEQACRDPRRTVSITSAFPLAEPQRVRFVEGLREATHQDVRATFEQDSSLIAGLRISAGPWMVRANVRDELDFFTEMMHHELRRQ